MLARLLKTELQPAPQPLPPTLVSIPCPKRRRKPAQIYRLYPTPQPETRIHAMALLEFVAEHSDAAGQFVPAADLAKFYENDLCPMRGWQPRHWTGVGRQLGAVTKKRSLRQNGQRFVCYQVPRPS